MDGAGEDREDLRCGEKARWEMVGEWLRSTREPPAALLLRLGGRSESPEEEC